MSREEDELLWFYPLPPGKIARLQVDAEGFQPLISDRTNHEHIRCFTCDCECACRDGSLTRDNSIWTIRLL